MSVQFSTTTGELFLSLMNVQQECGIVGKDAENPHFKSEYVSLEKLWTTVKPILKKHGLLVIQIPGSVADGKLTMETAVVHQKSGEFMISSGQMPVGREGPQAVGSAITYARRYFLACVLSIVAGDEDDDGEAAEGRTTQAAKSALVERKQAALVKLGKKHPTRSLAVVVGEILNRAVDDKLTLHSVDELSKLEAAVN